MNRLYSAALLPVILLACGPGPGPGGDAGADARGAGDAGLEIAPPDIPWLEQGMPPIAAPMLTPCPEGWHEVIEVDPDGEMDVVTCDPYGTEPGGTEPDVCPEGQAHFTGDRTGGRGLTVQEGATATVTRMMLSRNRDVGVFSSGEGTSLTLSDVVVRNTQAQESDGMGGRGLSIQTGATATVTRSLLSRNRDVGVFAHSLGTAVELLDVVVAQTGAQACADTTCTARPFGVGLLGSDGASLSATRFAVRDGALCGVMVAHDPQVDLAVGEVSGFQIGVCLQVDGHSVPRLTDRVRYVDNNTNLDTTSLPVPEVASPIDEAW